MFSTLNKRFFPCGKNMSVRLAEEPQPLREPIITAIDSVSTHGKKNCVSPQPPICAASCSPGEPGRSGAAVPDSALYALEQMPSLAECFSAGAGAFPLRRSDRAFTLCGQRQPA